MMLRGANLILALLLPVSSAVLFRGHELGSFDDPHIVPAAYAFSVWGPIYALCILYGIVQFLPARAEDPILQNIRPPMAFALATTNLWLLFASRELLWWTVVCMIAIAAGIGTAYLRASRVHLPAKLDRVAIGATTGMFAGWITLATFANLAVALKAASTPDPAVSWWMLSGAIVAAAVLTRAGGGRILYAATVVWGLAGIVVRNYQTLLGFAMFAAAGAIVLAAITFATKMQRMRKRRGKERVGR